MDENNQIENNQKEDNQTDPLPYVESVTVEPVIAEYQEGRQNSGYNNNVYQQPQNTQNNMALASLIMGIIGIVTSWCCCGGLLFGSLGILFALLSKTEGRFDKYAKAGLITSIIAFALLVVLYLAYGLLTLATGIGGMY